MNPQPSERRSEELLAQVRWVRALARELVPDPFLAEDLAQETYLAALRRPRGGESSLGGWLATVLRNFARQERRAEAGRRARELDAARTEALPSTLDLVEKLSAHRTVVEAVSALEEPYRTTILLRFFEELSPQAIARAQGVPVATVKTRLARALDRLRERLDRGHGGDGRAWSLALIPLIRPVGAPSALTLGTLIVTAKLKIAGLAAALVCVCAAALWFSSSRDDARAPAMAAAAPVMLERAPPPEARTTPAPAVPAERELAAEPARAAAPAVAAPSPRAAVVRGRVLDLEGLAVPGVHLWLHHGVSFASSREITIAEPPDPDAPRATSDASGRFEFEPQTEQGRVLTDDPGYATVLSPRCGPDMEVEALVVVAPRLEYAGRVRDEDGRPLADVRVVLLLPEHLRKGFAEVLDTSGERGWVARSDADGVFALADVPRVEGAVLQSRLEGWLVDDTEAPRSSTAALEIVLRRPAATAGWIGGQVVDARGRLVSDAHVSLGQETATTDERGTFAVRAPEGGTAASWIAVKPGHQPAIERPSPAVQEGRADPEELVLLRLGPAPLAISGRVVDARNEPLADIKVWLADPTFFGVVDQMPAHVEAMLAGAAGRSDLEKLIAELGSNADPEQTVAETASVFWNFTKTDADGRFRLPGLSARAYTLAALDTETLQRVESAPVRAGSEGVEIVLGEGCWERVAGRVVSASGEPVADVGVFPLRTVMTVRLDEYSSSGLQAQGRTTRTDADGRFELSRFPREGVYLHLDGEHILPLDFGRGDGGLASEGDIQGLEIRELEIRVGLRRHLKVELDADSQGAADHVAVLDADGARLRLHVFAGSSRTETNALELHDGRSDVMVVSDAARTLVLLHGDAELRRVPISLAAGEVNLIRP